MKTLAGDQNKTHTIQWSLEQCSRFSLATPITQNFALRFLYKNDNPIKLDHRFCNFSQTPLFCNYRADQSTVIKGALPVEGTG